MSAVLAQAACVLTAGMLRAAVLRRPAGLLRRPVAADQASVDTPGIEGCSFIVQVSLAYLFSADLLSDDVGDLSVLSSSNAQARSKKSTRFAP